jgi:hypothetical protein
MARMNWARVRDEDRVRDGRSNMELEEEREDRWLEREREREAERAQRRSLEGDRPASPRRPAGSKQVRSASTGSSASSSPTKRSERVLSKDEIASVLGVSVAELGVARLAESRASSGLSGISKKERLRLSAQRLGVSPEELTILRQALGGRVSNRQRASAAIRAVLTRAAAGGIKPSVAKNAQKSGKALASQTAGSRVAPSKHKPSRKSSAKPSTLKASPGAIYVTKWGNVVHLYWDCANARGFRHRGEPDADLYKVDVSDPCCRGRRVCATCNNISGVTGAAVERKLRSLHGKAFDERDWERRGWTRPMPKGKPINR